MTAKVRRQVTLSQALAYAKSREVISEEEYGWSGLKAHFTDGTTLVVETGYTVFSEDEHRLQPPEFYIEDYGLTEEHLREVELEAENGHI